jgi:hypothetical protein
MKVYKEVDIAKGNYGPALGAEVKRHDVVMGGDVVSQRLQDAPSICDEDTCA